VRSLEDVKDTVGTSDQDFARSRSWLLTYLTQVHNEEALSQIDGCITVLDMP
jgi:hypothetical protein